MRREKIGKTMKRSIVWGMIVLLGSSPAVHATEASVEMAEEFIIEPEEEVFDEELILWDEEIPSTYMTFIETESVLPDEEEQAEDTDIIQSAINAGTEVTITVNGDIIVNSTIVIPTGKTVAIIPAENKQVTMFRGENLCGTFFFVEKGGTLILDTGERLVIGEENESLEMIAAGEGEITQICSDLSADDTMIEDDIVEWETSDLADAYIEILNAEDLIYTGEPHMPDVFVWMGTQMLMRGFDYDVAYYNNVNAGTAEVIVTATGIGTCTGIGSTAFQIRPAKPQYEIEDQTIACGAEISQIEVLQYATGVQGEPVYGEIFWAASEGGNALPADMMLSGADGDSMELFWTFYPEENNTNYVPVSGSITVSFYMPEIPDMGDMNNPDLWGDIGDDVGNLSGGSSSSGVTSGDDISVDLSTELTTEAPETEEPQTEAPETEEPQTEAPETEAPQTAVPETEAPKAENNVIKNPVNNTTGYNTGMTVNRTGAGGSSSAVSVGNGVSVGKMNPKTGDDSLMEFWILNGLMALAAGIYILDTRTGIRYNGRR